MVAMRGVDERQFRNIDLVVVFRSTKPNQPSLEGQSRKILGRVGCKKSVELTAGNPDSHAQDGRTAVGNVPQPG